MTIVFKNTQIRHFWFQIYVFFCFFCKILQLGKFDGAVLKYDQCCFQIPAQKYLNKAFLVPNLGIFVFFGKVLQLDKFDGADFNYDNSFLKLFPKSTQIRHFWSQI